MALTLPCEPFKGYPLKRVIFSPLNALLKVLLKALLTLSSLTSHFSFYCQDLNPMRHPLDVTSQNLSPSLSFTLSIALTTLTLTACDPNLTGELIDASVEDPTAGREHGGEVISDLPDTPPPSIDCSTFSFELPPSLEMCTDQLEGEFTPSIGAQHIATERIIYEETPPSSGPHRPQWGRWGEYSWMPPERWLHNLEHGGVAFLYHPCAPQEVIDALRDFARAYPEDDGGAFRWVMTPYEDMSAPIAVVAWEWRAEMTCFDSAEVTAFIERVYRGAPEDVASDGAFSEGWIGR